MEKAKLAMVGLIVLLSIALLGAWQMRQGGGGLFQPDKPNWQWSDDWNSNQISPPPQGQPISPPNQSQPNPQPNQQLVAQTFDQAKQLSQQSGRPILLIFGASWCHWCQKMEQETLTDSGVKSSMMKYVFVKIDTDRDKSSTSQFGVRGLPTSVIANSSGQEVKKQEGFMDANKMKSFLGN